MQAKETKLQDIIEGTKQYVIPLFQRTYSWDKKEWDTLWNDLIELSEMEKPRTHFIGSIVNMPTISVPEGVSKYLLIDGQQRLTTVFIVLTLLRDMAKQLEDKEFSDEINNTLLVNPYKKDTDYYKLLPTQTDREEFKKLIHGKIDNEDCQIAKAYRYFEQKLSRYSIDKRHLKKIITNYLSIVSIVLDADDNPYLVFESLNAKGRPLTQADLIRNYFFMRIHVNEQDQVHTGLWKPMEDRLKDNLTEYIRHFLMLEIPIVKQNDVYYLLKNQVNPSNSIEYLRKLADYSKYYQKLLSPEFETNSQIKKALIRLNRIEVTTAYPLLLSLYQKFNEKVISDVQFIEILKTIENYLIRRFVCGRPTNQLNKIFPSIIPLLEHARPDDIHESIRIALQTRGYPKDAEFIQKLIESNLYGSGDRAQKAGLILETIEESFGHKEQVFLDYVTVEHIMPQKLTEWWQEHLGDEWEVAHELHLHTIGNLTLTAYNPELSNKDFPTKKKWYSDSHLELNKYFDKIDNWNAELIEKRTEHLTKIVLSIWPYFGLEEYADYAIRDITGTTPRKLIILGRQFEVKTWRDVLENTLNMIVRLEPDKINTLIQEYPKFIGKDKTKFREAREIAGGMFVETNLSAKRIKTFCAQALEITDLTSDDWKVETN